MNILEIYKKYKIMPQLAEHQLKVAGVASLICDYWNRGITRTVTRNHAEAIVDIDEKNVITACLLHDIGNIIKFDLSVTDKLHPGRFNKEDFLYWQKVKDEYIKKYGADEHHASLEIAKEIGVNERAVELIDCIGFQNGKNNFEDADFGKKICAYSDMRVAPKGVASLEERMSNLRRRYQRHSENTRERDEFENSLREIEKQIFAYCKIKPEEITEERVRENLEKLSNYDIEIVDKCS